jgi:hypothetical protein
MSELNRITTDPQLCGGRPCIRHMRIRVKDILDLLASGASTAEILEDYLGLCALNAAGDDRFFSHMQLDKQIDIGNQAGKRIKLAQFYCRFL